MIKSKDLELFIESSDKRIKQYLEDTLGNDFKPKLLKKPPICHKSIKYITDFTQIDWNIYDCYSIIWKEDGLFHIAGIEIKTIDKSSLDISINNCPELKNAVSRATHRLAAVICLGGEPLYSELHNIKIPRLIDAFWASGFIKEGSISVAACFTQDLMVPADCIATIEGYFQRSEISDCNSCNLLFHATCFTHNL